MKDFDTFGVMIDVSRNAVMNVPSLKSYIKVLANMGYNMVQLYTEDTYEIEGEPFFGYLRGRYTAEELREVDDFAASVGVELVPCIQTLAHLNCIVRWPAYSKFIDTNDILLADDERTYALIEKMFDTLESVFRSRRVNIGMDEAHMVGLGKYLSLHGYTERFDILKRHLSRVCEIAGRHGFRPMMWSDMFFRLANNGAYRGVNVVLPEGAEKNVPENIALTYWDYYSESADVLDNMLTLHKRFDREIWYAGGVWTWSGFAPFNEYSIDGIRLALDACRRHGIRNYFVTMWGDDGAECSRRSALPGLMYAAAIAEGHDDPEYVKARFRECVGGEFDDWMALDLPNRTLSSKGLDNPSKYMLYADPFLGIHDYTVTPGDSSPYASHAARLAKVAKRSGENADIFKTLSCLCKVLEIKYELGVRTRKAYRASDRETLASIAKKDLPVLIRRVKKFVHALREQWMRENKPQGFEVQDARLGGLILRLDDCRERLLAYLSGKLDRIPELEEDILSPSGEEKRGKCVRYNGYNGIYTACRT